MPHKRMLHIGTAVLNTGPDDLQTVYVQLKESLLWYSFEKYINEQSLSQLSQHHRYVRGWIVLWTLWFNNNLRTVACFFSAPPVSGLGPAGLKLILQVQDVLTTGQHPNRWAFHYESDIGLFFITQLKPHLKNLKVDLSVLDQTHFCKIPSWKIIKTLKKKKKNPKKNTFFWVFYLSMF